MGMAWGAAAGAGAQIGSSILDFIGKQQQQGAQNRQIDLAQQNMAAQQALQMQMQRQQREMQTASQTDADGNKLIYDPDKGWMPLLSPKGLSDQAAARGAQEIETRKYFGRGQWEDQQDFQRRFGQGRAANELLDAIRYKYGAPSKEGVTGANKIAAVTGVSDANDALKGGAAQAQLRTGSGAGPLEKQFETTDRSAATGVRSALAQTDANAGPLYEQIKADWRNNLASGYGKLAPQAGQAGAPQATSGALDAQVASRAARPMQINPYSGMGQNTASKQLIDAMGYQPTKYGAMFGGLAEGAKSLYEAFNPKDKGTPWNEDSRNDYAYNSWRF